MGPGRNYFMYNEIPKLYTETRNIVQAQIADQPFFACTTDIWTSRAVDAYMAVTIQYINNTYSDHTSDSLREALEEMVSERWGLDMSKMAGLTTDNASNNKKAFESFTWIPCFGHNLHLAVGKALALDRVSACLSRLRRTLSAFSRSNKMMRTLKEKQKTLDLPDHKLIHDEPTRWNSTFEMVDMFCEQQQAVCAVLAETRNKWHLMPKDSDMTILETVREVLHPLNSFTDALSGEKDPTLSSVLPLKWKLLSYLTEEEEDNLSHDMKEKIRTDFIGRYESNRPLDIVLDTATFLDPRFKDTFVSLEEDVKAIILQKADSTPCHPAKQAEAAKEEEKAGAK